MSELVRLSIPSLSISPSLVFLTFLFLFHIFFTSLLFLSFFSSSSLYSPLHSLPYALSLSPGRSSFRPSFSFSSFLCRYLSFSITLSIFPSVCLFLSPYLLIVYPSLSFSVCISPYICLGLPLSPNLFVYLSLSTSFSLSLSLNLSIYLSYLSQPLIPFIYFNLSISFSLSTPSPVSRAPLSSSADLFISPFLSLILYVRT